MNINNILGVVLAGGKSQRFGTDKSQVKLQNKLLIDYILEEIISQFNEIQSQRASLRGAWLQTFISGSCMMYWCHQNNIKQLIFTF